MVIGNSIKNTNGMKGRVYVASGSGGSRLHTCGEGKVRKGQVYMRLNMRQYMREACGDWE